MSLVELNAFRMMCRLRQQIITVETHVKLIAEFFDKLKTSLVIVVERVADDFSEVVVGSF